MDAAILSCGASVDYSPMDNILASAGYTMTTVTDNLAKVNNYWAQEVDAHINFKF